MFDLKVCGIFEASRWVDNRWPTRIISLVDPSIDLPWHHPRHLVIRMHDIEQDFGSRWIMPNADHLEKVLEFTEDITGDDRVLVHCHQGLSRSTAMAIGICVQHGMDAEAAYRHVESVRDILLPNAVIARLIDDRFGLNNSLMDLVWNERRAKMHQHMDNSVSITKHNDVVEMKSILEKIRDLR